MIILAILFLVAAMLLNVGLSVLFGFSNYFDETVEELNTSDAFFPISQHFWYEDAEQLIREQSTEFQANQAILLVMEIPWNDETLQNNIIFNDMDEARALSQWKLVGESLPMTPDGIYVPFLFYVNGFSLGDHVTFRFEEEDSHFTVAGFVEVVYTDMMGAPPQVFIPSARFTELWDAFSDFRLQMVFANGIENPTELEFLLLELLVPRIAFEHEAYFLMGISLAQVNANRTLMATMLSVMMISFTLVIAVVSLLVIRFRIKNSIEEDMPKIGSLQSIGYTSRQIRTSFVLQYGSIVLASALVSVLPAYLLMPLVSRVFAAQSGLFWQAGFTPVLNLITVLGLTLIVLLVAQVSARGIRKISPVLALRGGVSTHSFKRNRLPLEKSRLPINPALALKSLLQGMRQSLMMFFVLLAVAFTAVVALVIFYNASINLSAFEQVPGIERGNAAIVFQPPIDDVHALREEVLPHPDVRDAQFLDTTQIIVSDTFVGAIVMDDYNRRVTRNVYRGIFPRYDNEIAIAGLLASQLGVEVGDEVFLGRDELPFLVTGLTQGMEAGGPLTVYLTIDGARSIDPDFIQNVLMIYLYPGVDAAVFTAEMEEHFGERAMFVADGDAQFAEGVSGFASIMSLVGIVILLVSAFVVLLVLYFVIGSTIVRRHRDLGIQKAIGFTTWNLMNQISLALSFPILLGTATGAVLGAWLVNPGMSVGMAGLGVMQGSFIVNIAWVIASGVIIVILSYLISMLVTWRIRKISAYKLVTE